jgi:hypothetical protein
MPIVSLLSHVAFTSELRESHLPSAFADIALHADESLLASVSRLFLFPGWL